MKISKMSVAKRTQPTKTNLADFTAELRELSERFGYRLRSIGGLQVFEDGGQSNLVAVWERSVVSG